MNRIEILFESGKEVTCYLSDSDLEVLNHCMHNFNLFSSKSVSSDSVYIDCSAVSFMKIIAGDDGGE